MSATKSILSAVLYAALSLGAIPVAASDLDALRLGDMRKLSVHDEARPLVETLFLTKDGDEIDLTTFEGKYILLNFWATWCAPCREEMPSLDTLNQELGGEYFEVVAVATGRNPVPMIERFFARENISSLKVYRDPKQNLARAMTVFGLPVTVILDPSGKEIARLRGDADWHSPEALALLKALISHRAEES